MKDRALFRAKYRSDGSLGIVKDPTDPTDPTDLPEHMPSTARNAANPSAPVRLRRPCDLYGPAGPLGEYPPREGGSPRSIPDRFSMLP